MVFNLLATSQRTTERAIAPSLPGAAPQEEPAGDILFVSSPLGSNPVNVFEHFHPALGTKSIGLNDGALDLRRDLLTIADQLCQLRIGLGDPRTHQRAFRLIIPMDPLDAARLLIIQSKLRAQPTRG